MGNGCVIIARADFLNDPGLAKGFFEWSGAGERAILRFQIIRGETP
jgi:hypothetical protein